MIETVIFDLDGVIIDTEPLWDEANRLFMEPHGVTYDRAAVKPLIAGRTLREGTEIIKEMYGFPEEVDHLVAERTTLVEQQFRLGVAFLPGFLSFHTAISPALKSCVATSMDARFLSIVDRQLGLSTLFQGNIFSIADVGCVGKPDPALFLYAAQRMGSTPAHCLVIEDAPNGVQAARNAGMCCIAIASTFSNDLLAGADRVVRSFSEIDLATL